MKRILIDYKKLDHKVAATLIDSYPDGYGDDDILTIKKPNGEILEAVEVRTDDTIYLVKISKSLSNFMANFEETMEKELDRDLDLEPVPDFEEGSFRDLVSESDDLDNDGLLN
ncbi:hypothetical protein SAMN04487891_10833 [Flagellimonas taeanensis]|jgi:hypothetical protein|uniref:DNA primase n=1 Tax=Flagellimonas taeanensis TaxID=1005926 RepID=A0A1M7A2X8_9FLAO|nr:hypothetical protein [Allomuricauda taeanensis]SFC26459.1 hypothetical protein SAMN04487891_10833 [Allomuricauda taeanensis]SHL37112.1 hypothetical protein SAMN05216293_3336 [Allomuricauda taeanensis]